MIEWNLRRARVRLAVRRLMLDHNHDLNVNADKLMGHLRRMVGKTQARYSQITQTVDPIATGIAIGQRMMYDEICDLLYLDDNQRKTAGQTEDGE